MALDLFKRVETRKGLFAVEKITLIYNLLTSIIILFLFQEMDHPVQMLVDRVVIAGMTFLLMYLYRLAPCMFSSFIRIAIQMSLLSYWYPDTFEFNRIFPNLDHVFASAEQWVFGGQPAVWRAAPAGDCPRTGDESVPVAAGRACSRHEPVRNE